jgi:hypothetical protein
LANLTTAYQSTSETGITGLGNEAVTLSDSSVAATALNLLDGLTTGTIYAGSVTTLTGSIDTLSTTYQSSINGLGNEDITLSDTSATASALNKPRETV